MSNSFQLQGLQPARLLCPWTFPAKNIGMDCHSLLQGIFLTQISRQGLVRCRWIFFFFLNHMSQQGRGKKKNPTENKKDHRLSKVRSTEKAKNQHLWLELVGAIASWLAEALEVAHCSTVVSPHLERWDHVSTLLGIFFCSDATFRCCCRPYKGKQSAFSTPHTPVRTALVFSFLPPTEI